MRNWIICYSNERNGYNLLYEEAYRGEIEVVKYLIDVGCYDGVGYLVEKGVKFSGDFKMLTGYAG